jgi:hypothetical protein
LIEEFVGTKLNLKLKERATRLAPVTDGVPFLGFRIFPNLIRLQRKNLVRFRRKVRAREQAFKEGKIGVEAMSRSVASLVAHVSHANSLQFRRAIFARSEGFG